MLLYDKYIYRYGYVWFLINSNKMSWCEYLSILSTHSLGGWTEKPVQIWVNYGRRY
jgi:hypothetical protein